MDLKKDYISEKYFRSVIIVLISISVLIIFWSGMKEIQNFQSVFDESAPADSHSSIFNTGELSLTKTSVLQTDSINIIRYVTIGHLHSSPSHQEASQILTTSYGFAKINGLSGHPSFLITAENESFWKSQFYMELGYRSGGILILIILSIFIVKVNFKYEKKLFVKRILKIFGIIYALVVIGFVLETFFYGRIIHFLNKEFFLGEPLVGGTPQALLFAAMVLLFLIITLQRGIRLQEEYDLTV